MRPAAGITRRRRSLQRRCLKLILGLNGRRQEHHGVSGADAILNAVHRHLGDELPLDLRLHEAFSRLDEHERNVLVQHLEALPPAGRPAQYADLDEVRSHERGVSFANEGEDLILNDMFPADYRGFYVDIGAHHPYRYSNTAFFSLRGWCGINVDAAPGTRDSFTRFRPNDVTIECAVGADEGAMDFFVFDEPALSTFEPERARQLERETSYRIKEVRSLPVRRLDSILDEYLPAGRQIDFLSVDVEGHESAVVKSNDWNRFRPRIVLLELLGRGLLDLAEDPLVGEMRGHGYEPTIKCVRSVFFTDTASRG